MFVNNEVVMLFIQLPHPLLPPTHPLLLLLLLLLLFILLPRPFFCSQEVLAAKNNKRE